MDRTAGNIRRVHINSEMDLFDLVRTVIYPILEERLDVVFPEFDFQKVSNGWWLARNAPIGCQGFGHKKGRLAATTWGFRSLDRGSPTVFWLSYMNRMELPNWQELPDAVRRLALKVNHHFQWTPNEEACRNAREKFRLYHLLDPVLVYAQNNLLCGVGQEAREYLTQGNGFQEKSLLGLELGYYDSVRDCQNHLKESGFGGEGDLELAGLMGLFQEEWEGRVIGPWRDRFGKRVFNLWGRAFSPMPGESIDIPSLRRPRVRALAGSTDIPFGLDRAFRNKRKHLILVRSPFTTLLPSLGKLESAAFIASGGKVTAAQVNILEKYLRNEGSLTLNLDFDPGAGRGHRDTLHALDELEGVDFPVYVVNPEEMVEDESLIDPIGPEQVIREKGLTGYVKILRKRLEPDEYRARVS